MNMNEQMAQSMLCPLTTINIATEHYIYYYLNKPFLKCLHFVAIHLLNNSPISLILNTNFTKEYSYPFSIRELYHSRIEVFDQLFQYK